MRTIQDMTNDDLSVKQSALGNVNVEGLEILNESHAFTNPTRKMRKLPEKQATHQTS